MFRDFKTEIKTFLLVVLVAIVVAVGGVLVLKTLQPTPSPMPVDQQILPPPPSPQVQTEVFDTSTWQTYRNDKFGFEVKYPPTWRVQDEHPNSRNVFLIDQKGYDAAVAKDAETKSGYLSYSKINLYTHDWDLKNGLRALIDATGGEWEIFGEIIFAGQPAFEVWEGGYGKSYTIFFKKDNVVFEIILPLTWSKESITNVENQILSTFRFVDSSTGVPPGYSANLIDVKFKAGTDVDPPEEALPLDLRDLIVSIRPSFTLSKEELDRLGGNLNLWFQVTLRSNTNSVDFIKKLRNSANVETAEFAPLPAPPP